MFNIFIRFHNFSRMLALIKDLIVLKSILILLEFQKYPRNLSFTKNFYSICCIIK